MTQEEFANQIKQKYPQYQNIDNATLTSKIVEKYPVYRDKISDFGTTPQVSTVAQNTQPISSTQPVVRAVVAPETENNPTFAATGNEGVLSGTAKAVGNIPSSAVGVGKGLLNVVEHPIDTVKNLGQLAYGLGEKAGQYIVENTDIGQSFLKKANELRQQNGLPLLPTDETGRVTTKGSDVENDPHLQTVNKLGEYFLNRYGTLENLKKSAIEDPVGVAMDVSALFTGGESVLAKGASVAEKANLPNVASKLAKASDLSGKVAQVTDPLTPAIKGVTKGKETIQNVTNKVKGIVSSEEGAIDDFATRLSDAEKSIFPKLSPTEKQSVKLKDQKGLIGKKSVPDLVNDPKTKPIIESVANLPEDLRIKPSDTVTVREEKLSQGISRLHSETDSYLAQPEIKAKTTFNGTKFDKYMKEQVLNPIQREFGVNSIEYKDALKAVKTAKNSIETFDGHGVHTGRQKFNEIFESENPRAYKKAKGSFGAQLDQQTNSVIEAGRETSRALRDFTSKLLKDAKLSEIKNFQPKEIQPLIEKASRFDKKSDYIKSVMRSDKKKLRENFDFTVDRNPQTGYKTTAEQDLGEIWDIAHSEAQVDDPILNRLREESNLIRAKEEMRARSTGELDKDAFDRTLDKNPFAKKAYETTKNVAKTAVGLGVVLK